MKNQLLSNIFYGNEGASLESGSANIRAVHEAEIDRECSGDWQSILDITRSFFASRKAEIWGGPITAGDALFILSYMARLRPKSMIEIGVASGFSSAFILFAAEKLGLLGDGIFLTSYDILETLPNNQPVGNYCREYYAPLCAHWELLVGRTSMDLLAATPPGSRLDGPVLAFVDGGHCHPWPSVDILALHQLMPPGGWILMQDYQMMERWFADTIEFGVPMRGPVRGVNLAVANWPGEKFIGSGMSYNMAALKTDSALMNRFLESMDRHIFEIDFSYATSLCALDPTAPLEGEA